MFAKLLKSILMQKKSIICRNFTLDSSNTPRLPLGGNFEEYLNGNYIYADKTLLIKMVLDEKHILVTRPRRWGKTMNLTMLKSFYELKVSNEGVILKDQKKEEHFKNFLIGSETLPYNPLTQEIKKTRIIDLQGQFPIVYLEFEDVRPTSKRHLELRLAKILRNAVEPHRYLLQSKTVKHMIKLDILKQYLTNNDNINNLDESDIINTVKALIICLKQHFGKNVILLVDEYDKFLLSLAEENSEFFDYGLYLFSSMFSNLKGLTEEDIFFSYFTGVTRIARKNSFSGLNNFVHDSIENPIYAELYGLTDKEVDQLIQNSNKSSKLKFDEIEVKQQIKRWYNGYNIGGKIIYNPYSVVNCLKRLVIPEENPYLRYWSRSGSTEIFTNSIKNLKNKEFIDILIKTNTISFTPVNYIFEKRNSIGDNGSYKVDIFKTDESFLTLMLDAGYLTKKSNKIYCIPNREIFETFQEEVAPSWIEALRPYFKQYAFKDSEIENVELFCNSFQNNILDNTNVDNNPEYLFKSLLYYSCYSNEYKLRKYIPHIEYSTDSNKKIDMILIPIEFYSDTLFVIEYKKGNQLSTETLKNNAIQQIMQSYAEFALKIAISKQYKHIKKIVLRAVAFIPNETKWKISADELKFDRVGLNLAIIAFKNGEIPKATLFEQLSKYTIKEDLII